MLGRACALWSVFSVSFRAARTWPISAYSTLDADRASNWKFASWLPGPDSSSTQEQADARTPDDQVGCEQAALPSSSPASEIPPPRSCKYPMMMVYFRC